MLIVSYCLSVRVIFLLPNRQHKCSSGITRKLNTRHQVLIWCRLHILHSCSLTLCNRLRAKSLICALFWVLLRTLLIFTFSSIALLRPVLAQGPCTWALEITSLTLTLMLFLKRVTVTEIIPPSPQRRLCTYSPSVNSTLTYHLFI